MIAGASWSASAVEEKRASPRAATSTSRRSTAPSAPGSSTPSAVSTSAGALSDTMCSSSRSPAFGLTGVNGTPASSAPTAATHVSRRASANTATRSRPATAAATAAAASASCAYVSACSPKRIASLSLGAGMGGRRAHQPPLFARVGRRRQRGAHAAIGTRRDGPASGHRVLHLADEPAAVVGDDAGRLLRQAGRLAELLRDLRDLLGRVVRREHVGLGRQVDRRGALRRVVDDHEVLARLGVRAVEDRDDLLVVLRREAVDSEVAAALEARLALGFLGGRDPRAREHLHEVGARELLDRAG